MKHLLRAATSPVNQPQPEPSLRADPQRLARLRRQTRVATGQIERRKHLPGGACDRSRAARARASNSGVTRLVNVQFVDDDCTTR